MGKHGLKLTFAAHAREKMLDPDDEQIIKDAKDGGAILVTWDRVMRLAAGGITPYEALDQAAAAGTGTTEAQAEVSRLHKLTPAELTVMAGAANKTYESFNRDIHVVEKAARQIRQLRVEKDYSWRAVARFYSGLWGAPWGGNQIAGMVLCKKAAKLLGEDFMQPPWNSLNVKDGKMETKQVKLRDNPFLLELTGSSMTYQGESPDKVITIAAVEGEYGDWAAYMETPESGKCVAEYGSKLPQTAAEELFPDWAKCLRWRP